MWGVRRGFGALLLAVLLVVTSAAQSQDAGVLFEAARKAEVVEGDLAGAISLYMQIAERFKSDPRTAARALLRAAELHAKRGDLEARRLFERILRTYSSTPEAAVARQRIADPPGGIVAAEKGDRAVWKGPNVDLFGTISPDGRYLTYVDWNETENLMVRDLVKGTDRPLTPNQGSARQGWTGWSAVSRDGAMVAYQWQDVSGRHEIRLVSLAGRSMPVSKRLLQCGDGEDARPYDWSPDGERIAVALTNADSSLDIGILSVRDGTVRRLRSVGWHEPDKMVFSPDGRWMAFDVRAASRDDGQHIQIQRIDGGAPTDVVTDRSQNTVMGWSPDGQLLFASDRTGSMALWAVPVLDGTVQAGPTLVRGDLGTDVSLGLTPAGTLYVWKRAHAPMVRVAAIDRSSNRLTDVAGGWHRFIESRGRPDWSANGSLLFVSCGPSGGGRCAIFVRAPDGRTVHEVPHGLGYVFFPRLSPDARRIVTWGRDPRTRVRGLYLIETATGKTTLLVSATDLTRRHGLTWSADGEAVQFFETRGGEAILFERAIDGGQTKEILRIPEPGVHGPVQISPDRRFAAALTTRGGESRLVVYSTVSGAPRLLSRQIEPRMLSRQWQWLSSSDGIITTTSPDEDAEVWVVPLEGEPRRLAVDTSFWVEGGHLRLHPDGRTVAFVAAAGKPWPEVWALENLLPARSGGSRK